MRKEFLIDGYSGFFLLDKNRNPKVALHIENEFRWTLSKHRSLHPDKPLPHITPHVCRHTFCTNMNPKTLQYLMGHSDIGVTLNVYTHLGLEDAAAELARMEAAENARREQLKISMEEDKAI